MQRDTRLDLIKAIAIFGVLLIHICGYEAPIASFHWLGSVFWRTLFAAAVPLFLMCSGALLNAPTHPMPLKKLYLKNILRILVAGLFWAFLYKLYYLLCADTITGAALWQAVKETLLFQHEFHLYYIQMILLVYVCLPMTRLFAQHASRREFIYALGVWFAVGILLPTFSGIWPLTLLGGVANMWWLNIVYASVGYALLGYYLLRYPLTKLPAFVFLVLGIAITFGTTVIGSVVYGQLYTRFLEGMSVGICFLAIGIFSCCLLVKSVSGIFVYISKASFLVYLSHMFVIYFLRGVLHFTVYSFASLFSAPTIAILTLAVCLLLYFILSKIPFVKKWLI